ncbi:MAG: substrate-binding domain-containing protein [Candidatus Acidiferrum sp.]|jgi:ribose transport system substrate-binding protein
MSRYRGEIPQVEMPSCAPCLQTQAMRRPAATGAAFTPQAKRPSARGLVALQLFAFLALAGALISCGPEPYHQQDERYVLVATSTALPYWQEAQAGLQDSAKVLGVKAEMIGPEGFAPDKELEAFQKAVGEKPAGILVSVARPDAFKSAIDAAVSAGIPVICLDADAPDTKRVLFIGTDNFRAGQESGRRMAQILKGQGRVAIVTLVGQLNVEDRVRGVNDALTKFPGIKVVATIDDKGDARAANDQISKLLGGKDKPDGIICLEASGGSGAAEALHRLDLTGKVAIVAFDKDPETLDFIQGGAINETIAQKPYVMAYYGLKLLDDLHHNAVHEYKDWRTSPAAPIPTFVDTGTAVVDKANLAQFKEELAAHPKPL